MKSIIIYFSRADENYAVGNIEKGNTEVIAEYIRDLTGSEMFKIEPLNPYARDYDTCIEQAKQRQKTHEAPIKEEIPDLTEYDVIYLESPVYWGDMPEELVVALKMHDYTSKVIKPFITHEGSGSANIPNKIMEVCKNADVTSPLIVRGSEVYDAKNKVESWLNV